MKIKIPKRQYLKVKNQYKQSKWPKGNSIKEFFYKFQNHADIESNVKIVGGGRNCGKSSDISTWIANDCIVNNRMFIYLRNLNGEVTQKAIDGYIKGIRLWDPEYPALSKWDGLRCTRNKDIYIYKLDADGDIEYEQKIGISLSIENAHIYKSQALPLNIFKYAVLEEFVSKARLPDDFWDRYVSILSTFGRWHSQFTVIGITNLVSRNNFMFENYELPSLDTLKVGYIHTFEVLSDPPIYDETTGEQLKMTVSVEYAENGVQAQKHLLGKKSQRQTSGDAFEEQDMPLIDFEQKKEVLYRFFIWRGYNKYSVRLCMNTSGTNAYLEVYDSKKTFTEDDRVITDMVVNTPLWSTGFYSLSSMEQKTFDLIKQHKVFFKNNLVGTSFTEDLQYLLKL